MALFSEEELQSSQSSNKVGEQPTFLKPEQAAQVEPNLPPLGAARDDLLAQRTDALAEAAETQTPDTGKIPERFLEPDREIQSDIENDYMNIGSNNPLYKTCWVNFANLNGQMIWKKKAQGWQVATPEVFPEAEHLCKADNTIRVGDVLLMFIRIDFYQKLIAKEEENRRRQQYGLDSSVYELANKHPNIFKNVSTDDNPTLNPQTQELVEKRRGATKSAINAIGQQMKSPNGVPGIPLPGREG